MFDFHWWLYDGLYQAPRDKAILFDYNILSLTHLCSCLQGSTQFNLLIGESLDFKFYFCSSLRPHLNILYTQSELLALLLDY